MLFKTIKPIQVNKAATDNIKLWHKSMGHINLKVLKELSEKEISDKIDYYSDVK